MNNQKAQNTQELWDNLERYNTCAWNSRRTNEAEETFEVMLSISKINDRHQTTHQETETPGRILWHIIFNCSKPKTGKPLKEARRIITVGLAEQCK